jgi:hypothetical protein
MASLMQYGMIIILVVIAITAFPKVTLFVLGIGLLLFLIRLGADLYWWMKDRGDI